MTIRDIDYDIRKLNSVLLRITLIIVLLTIYHFNENYFQDWAYPTFIISYIVFLFINLKKTKNSYQGRVRNILDLLLIGAVLFDKDVNNILNYLPFFLLLYNIHSHSNRNAKIYYFILFLHSCIFIVDHFKFDFTHQVIPFIFYPFFFLTYLRNSISMTNEELILLIGNLFIENMQENNSHIILKNIISQINDSRLKTLIQVQDIFIFINIKDKFVSIKGSKFVKNNEIQSQNGLPNLIQTFKIDELKIQKDIVKIDNIEYKNSYWLKHSILNNDYFFLVCLKKDNLFSKNIILHLRPIFVYISRIYSISNTLNGLKDNNAKVIKQKIAYVFDAQNALHFVKNKLSPITSTIDLMDRYFKNTNQLTPEQISHIEKRLRDNKNKTHIKSIIQKAEVLIKGVDNILDEKDEIISLRGFIQEIRKNWMFHFENIDDISIEIEDLNDIKLSVNKMMFDFIFTDIIENISKYSNKTNKKVSLKRDQDSIIILFCNLIQDFDKHKKELSEMVNLYNQKDNDEIYSRKTHGLSFVRRLLRRKNIENSIFIDTDKKTFNFKITLKVHIG